jgi:hypothetical protein
MSFNIRYRVPLGKRFWLNISKSGVSLSARAGRVTVNSRGSIWVRIAKGIFYRKSFSRSD